MNKEMFPAVKKHIPRSASSGMVFGSILLVQLQEIPLPVVQCLACVRDAVLAESNSLSATPQVYIHDGLGSFDVQLSHDTCETRDTCFRI